MSYRFQRPNDGFITRAADGTQMTIISPGVLVRCRRGLSKHIKNAKSKEDKARIKSIRSEIDYLIDNL